MKRIKLVGMLALGLLAVNIAATNVNAAEISGEDKESDTSVKIIDNEDPDERVLVLKSVPSRYDFESTLQNGTYTLETDLSNQNIVVFNNQVNGDWSVKASVVGNEITRVSDSTPYEVTSFKVNSFEIVGTGSDGIVAKAGAPDINKVGDISTKVTKVSIGFKDSANSLVPDDELTGKINYKLFDTPDAN
ncbi:hypothetical protein [Enterococcus alishanensis]|uniref:hypothetical protein n=1 Tax=Enterococcus alishanensis TaxID=1303817 RepID=UPI001FE798E2|nr:hypothetical protein [Enterococcus alishanensis]